MCVPMDFTKMGDLSSDDSEDSDSEEEEMEDENRDEGDSSKQDDDDDKNSDTVVSSDDDDDKDEEALNREISVLKTTLAENPFHYDSHVSLISSLVKSGELESLRAARESMASLFPLTPELWLKWIKDERSLDGDRGKVTVLFERAVADYVSVNVWAEFCAYAIGSAAFAATGSGASDATDATRAVFERALSVVGLHVAQGRLIWESYREFEMMKLSLMQPPPGAVVAADLQPKIDAQTRKLLKLFERQLGIPHSNMAATMNEYEEWKGGSQNVGQVVKKSFIEAKKRLVDLQKLEDELEAADENDEDSSSASQNVSSKEAVFEKYIDFEWSKESPARIQLIFERAITQNPLNADLWIRFGDYLDGSLKILSCAVTLYHRATRNCPWKSELWRRHMLALERNEEGKAKLDEVYAKALAAGFSTPAEYGVVIGAYLDFMRRRCGKIQREPDGGKAIEDDKLSLLRGAFDQAVEFLANIPDSADEIVHVSQYSARFEAKQCGNVEAARKIYAEQIFPLGFNVSFNTQMEFINLERAYGSIKHVRRHFHKAMNSSQMDYPEALFEAYLTFEREEGSLEEFVEASTFVEKQRRTKKEREGKRAEKEEREKGGGREKEKRGGKAEGNKRTHGNESSEMQNGQPAVKKFKQKDEVRPTNAADAEGVFKVPQLPKLSPKASKSKDATAAASRNVSSTKEDSKAGSKANAAAAAVAAPPVDEALEKRDRTVFVSNMNFSASEDDLREAFKFCGGISSIRLVSDAKTGKPRGFGYVEFVESKGAEAALKMDRYLVKDRPLYISEVKEKGAKSEKKFQFTTGLEPRKLFIKNLPLVANSHTLMTMFSAHGDVVNVRLVTMKSGKSKGMAYVEFSTEEQAKKAMLQTDGVMVGENKIEVAISNTPARKADGDGGGGEETGGTTTSVLPSSSTAAASSLASRAAATSDSAPAPHLGGGKKETLERGKAHTQISLVPRSAGIMMPRSLKAKTVAKPVATPGTAAAGTVTAAAVASEPEAKGEEIMEVEKKETPSEEPKKSNDDFRKLFFK